MSRFLKQSVLLTAVVGLLLALGGTAPAGIISDDFSAPPLDLGWTWDNPSPDGNTYSLTARSGWLQISLVDGRQDTWTGSTTGRGKAPFMLTDTVGYPAPNFSVETRVDMATSNGGVIPGAFIAGLLVTDTGNSSEYPFEFSYGYSQHGSQPITYLDVQACGTGTALLRTTLSYASAYLKMDRDGTAGTWTMSYKQNAGDSWNLLGAINDSQLPGGGINGAVELGMWAKTYGGVASSGANADFDFYYVVPEPGTLALLATGLIGLLCYAWRKRK